MSTEFFKSLNHVSHSSFFTTQFLGLALTRTVKENYKVFIEYMEGILANNIPSKILNPRHNLPGINRNLKTNEKEG